MEEALPLGFNEVPEFEDDSKSPSSSNSRKLVPWLNWNEWLFVRDSLFSDSPNSFSDALKRISVWRTRGCLPELIDITAIFLEIQHMDPFFRQDLSNDGSVSEQILINLYSVASMRIVNAVAKNAEKSRKKEYTTIAAAADEKGLPRMLVDIRHEVSHRGLPSLKLARISSIKALDWLKSNYWEPQSKAIPFHGEDNANIKKEIKTMIRELAICLKVGGSPESSTLLLKGKPPKKPIKRILKSLLRLYSSFSSEVVSVLLDYLLKTSSSSEFKKKTGDASAGPTIDNVLADWKPVILRLYNKEPELFLNLLEEVLHRIEAREDMKCEEDNPSIGIAYSKKEFHRSSYLSSLFAWLVRILGKTSSNAANMPKRVLHELVRKCLLISHLCDKQVMDSALHLAQLIYDRSLLQKVQLLSGLVLSNVFDNADDQSSLLSPMNVSQFEESMREAYKKLDFVKQQIMRNKKSSEMNCETEETEVWALAKSWNPCPLACCLGLLVHLVAFPFLMLSITKNTIKHQKGKRIGN
ncbi:LOW QUALITY PROTEIN: pre-rRNA-processing protein las1 [Medicago truncatula]|uniref:LOW QUALITY PROTEIN: pre-rRNA-processing protein las1 n=1 Tax=Medicago truncatula TaxID=3880 RepID=UPI000D2F18B2|nr:LOW QUALITY PROTEIN: pre-rRNA-processing protein las1 [Medicago truncatula]